MNIRLLSKYLFQFHVLPLPELGLMILNKQPSRLNVLDKTIESGHFLIEIKSDHLSADHLIDWLSAELNITVHEVSLALREYVSKIKERLNVAGKFDWGNLGVLEKDESGQFKFSAGIIQPSGYAIIQAVKFVRKNADHEVRVGDKVYSGADMKNLLTKEKVKAKGYWILLCLVLIFLLLTTIGIIAINKKDFLWKHQYQFHMKSTSSPATYSTIKGEE